MKCSHVGIHGGDANHIKMSFWIAIQPEGLHHD